MKKELVVAILIGIILGFTVTGLIWANKQGKLKLNLSFGQKPATKETSPVDLAITPEPTPESPNTNNENLILKINEPINESISDKESVALKGTTLAKATIVVIWEEGEDILVADEKGAFETEITLVSGENQIEITTYDDNGNQKTENLTIIYSTAKI